MMLLIVTFNHLLGDFSRKAPYFALIKKPQKTPGKRYAGNVIPIKHRVSKCKTKTKANQDTLPLSPLPHTLLGSLQIILVDDTAEEFI